MFTTLKTGAKITVLNILHFTYVFAQMTFMEETMSADSMVINDVERIAAETDDFVRISQSHHQSTLLYLFARTDREKEVWSVCSTAELYKYSKTSIV